MVNPISINSERFELLMEFLSPGVIFFLLALLLACIIVILSFYFRVLNRKNRKSPGSPEELYRTLFESANDAMFILDREMLILDANETACNRLGYTKEEMIGMSIQQIDTPGSAEKIPGRKKQVLVDGFATFEATHRTRDGKEIPVEISVKKVEIEGRSVLFSIVRDISARKKNEQLLHERETKYRAVIETSLDGFWVLDLEGRFLEVNDIYLRLSGYSHEEMLQMKVSDIEAVENPEDIKKHIQKVLRNKSDRFETRHIKKNGETWPVEIVISFSPLKSGVLIVFIIDITERKKYEKKILDLAMFPAQNPNPVLRISREGEILFRNKPSEKLLYLWEQEGKLNLPEEILSCSRQAINDQKICTIELQVEHHYYMFCVAPVTNETYLNIYGMDITEHVKNQEQIKVLSRAISQSPVSVIITDLRGQITYVNPKFTEVSGYSEQEVLGKNPRLLKSGKQSNEFYKNMWDTIKSGKEWRGEFENLTKDGRPYWESASISAVLDSKNQPISFIAVKEDITEKKRKEDKIHYLALHDNLTGLYNRTAFKDHLKKILQMAERNGTRTTLLFMDLNGFKQINDTYGHHVGDEMLKKVGQDLTSSVRQMDIVARMGGDEFAVILPETEQKDGIEKIIHRFIQAIEKPLQIGSIQCKVGVSTGIIVYPDGWPLEELLMRADRAMYAAKGRGNNMFAYSDELDDARK